MQHVNSPNIMEIAARATVAAWSDDVNLHAGVRPSSLMSTTTTSSINRAKLKVQRRKVKGVVRTTGDETRVSERGRRRREE